MFQQVRAKSDPGQLLHKAQLIQTRPTEAQLDPIPQLWGVLQL